MPKAYENAGVSVEAGYEVVKRIKSHVARTNRPGVVGGIGGFGGLFDLASLGYKEPVLISGTDGVGTKLMVAKLANKHDTIGIDCVAMCVNDIAAQGAEPLFFLDYIACGKNDPALLEQVVHRTHAESFDGVSVESRREDDPGPGREHPRELHAAEFRHLDIAEKQVHRFGFQGLECRDASVVSSLQFQKGGFPHVAFEQFDRQRLVVDNGAGQFHRSVRLMRSRVSYVSPCCPYFIS